ncbi:MAG: hypothetical protein MZV70_04880 [Desulfobacterales bacterium]|nr:hypothetical protein [Desulfobacterales bacterium]
MTLKGWYDLPGASSFTSCRLRGDPTGVGLWNTLSRAVSARKIDVVCNSRGIELLTRESARKTRGVEVLGIVAEVEGEEDDRQGEPCPCHHLRRLRLRRVHEEELPHAVSPVLGGPPGQHGRRRQALCKGRGRPLAHERGARHPVPQDPGDRGGLTRPCCRCRPGAARSSSSTSGERGSRTRRRPPTTRLQSPSSPSTPSPATSPTSLLVRLRREEPAQGPGRPGCAHRQTRL